MNSTSDPGHDMNMNNIEEINSIAGMKTNQ